MNGVGKWQEQAVRYARVMSRAKWVPVADSMPIRGGGCFAKGTEYTGVPYSSVKSVGRYIGFDIFLKTFLAAVENPLSVLYTEDLSGKVDNAAAYYGKVCSSFTSYALQCGIWYVSRHHTPPRRDGVGPVIPQSARTVAVGDIIFTPPASGAHVELVTDVTTNGDGVTTHVRVTDSWPPTTRTIDRDAAEFDAHLAANDKRLYRIIDLDAWRGGNRAEGLRFPDYGDDSAAPVVNRVLLLDRGDWVPYHLGQPVRINVMDRDSTGVKALVVNRGDAVVEESELPGPGVVERLFPICGDYTVRCARRDDSMSPACEFAVSDLDFTALPTEVAVTEAWEIGFRAENMAVVLVYLHSDENPDAVHSVFVTDQDRRNGKIAIPAGLVRDAGNWQVWLIGENRYGRLKKRGDIAAIAR